MLSSLRLHTRGKAFSNQANGYNRRGGLALLLLALTSCRRVSFSAGESPSGSASARRSPELGDDKAPVATSSALAPLTNVPWLETLSVKGGNASIAIPVGATEPRPVVVAIHGAGDRPEWACGGWRIATGGYPFLVCPRGVPVDAQRFAWPSSRAIEVAIDESLAAARAQFNAYMAPGPMVYAAFSQGAILARPLLLTRTRDFPTVVLAEGGYDIVESATFARQFRREGGQRVMLVCGGQGCLHRMRGAQAVLTREGLMVSVVGDPRAGHNLNEPMQQALRRAWPAFVAGDPHWAGLSYP